MEAVEDGEEFTVAELERSGSEKKHPLEHVAESSLQRVGVPLGLRIGEQAGEAIGVLHMVGLVKHEQWQAYVERAKAGRPGGVEGSVELPASMLKAGLEGPAAVCRDLGERFSEWREIDPPQCLQQIPRHWLVGERLMRPSEVPLAHPLGWRSVKEGSDEIFVSELPVIE